MPSAAATRFAPRWCWAAAVLLGWQCAAAHAFPAAAGLSACRLKGVEHGALCGSVRRALDPAQPSGTQIDVHYAVLPAVARNKHPDPVFFFAGGPGQSAMALAGPISGLLARFGNRRDLVLVDQRGTGRSAPLHCAVDDETRLPLAEQFDAQRQLARLADCRIVLQKLPYGDLRRFTTPLAVQDVDAVRAALGASRINLVGASYGTRAALEYQRQFPQHVRRTVLDGAAPPDMVLPASFSTDNQAALDALFAACEREPRCADRFPTLRMHWAGLLAGLPREVSMRHPFTGQPDTVALTRDVLLAMVRGPLYTPAMASGLPLAISEAAAGRFEALAGLASALGGGSDARLAAGMHFSVVCSEDAPRLAGATDRPGEDFGGSFGEMYLQACADWPRGNVPGAFYALPPAPAPTLVVSGGIDPATPPRHGERVVRALGPNAVHVVAPGAGHGVMSIGCMSDVLFRFVDAAADADALRVDASCVQSLPRPFTFVPPGTE